MTRATFSLLMLITTGCAATLTVTKPLSHQPGTARVWLQEQKGDMFKLVVLNESPYPMTVLRDTVTLVSSSGRRARKPGGLQSTYTLPPGGSHPVHVRYELDGLNRGQPVTVCFDGALLVAGAPVVVPPLEFVVD